MAAATTASQSVPPEVGAAVEAAIAPLKHRQPGIVCKYGTAVSLMDQALAQVFNSYSKLAVKGYLWTNVHYCLHDGTFHDSQRKLKQYLRKGRYHPKDDAKQYQNAKLLLGKTYP